MRARLSLTALALVLACDSDPAAPPPAPPLPFYPLSIGQTWRFDRARRVRFLTPDGTTDVQPPLELHAVAERILTATEEMHERTYVIEEERVFREGGPDTVISWRRYRQDDSGLYRANVPLSIPPGSVSSLDSLVEITVLSYPLEVSGEWSVTPGSATRRRVEALDTLSVPVGTVAAYRVRILRANEGPDDVHREWYGRDGLVRVLDHVEFLAVDAGTGDVIRVVSDDESELTERLRVHSASKAVLAGPRQRE